MSDSYEVQLVYKNSEKKYIFPQEIFEKVLKKEDLEKLKIEVLRQMSK